MIELRKVKVWDKNQRFNQFSTVFLMKKILSAGSSYQKFCRILRKYVMESSKEHSDWKFYQDIKEIVPKTFDQQENFHMPSVSEARCTACVVQPLCETWINSAIPDPDAMFLKQLLPCMLNLNQRAKSEFKSQTQALMYKLQFNENDNLLWRKWNKFQYYCNKKKAQSVTFNESLLTSDRLPFRFFSIFNVNNFSFFFKFTQLLVDIDCCCWPKMTRCSCIDDFHCS